MKKLIPILIIVLCLLCGVCLADTYTSPEGADFTYEVYSDNVCITGCVYGSGDLVIPSQINGYDVTELGSQAFFGMDNLTSVTLPDTLQYIDDWTFAACGGLTEITIPDSVIEIGESAFAMCTNLETVTLTSVSTQYDSSAFDLCPCRIEYDIPTRQVVFRPSYPVQQKTAQQLGSRRIELVSVSASSYLTNRFGDYPPEMAFDDNRYTSWVEDTPGSRISDWICGVWEVNSRYADQYAAYGITIRTGMQKQDNELKTFKQNSRPKEIEIFINDEFSFITCLADSMDKQTITFDGEAVRPDVYGDFEVTIQILSIYQEVDSSPNDFDICIADVDLILIEEQ